MKTKAERLKFYEEQLRRAKMYKAMNIAGAIQKIIDNLNKVEVSK